MDNLHPIFQGIVDSYKRGIQMEEEMTEQYTGKLAQAFMRGFYMGFRRGYDDKDLEQKLKSGDWSWLDTTPKEGDKPV